MPLNEGDGLDAEEYGDDFDPADVFTPEPPTDQQQDAADQEPYQPFDITQVRTSAPREAEPLRDEDGTALPSFDERYREDFEGLAFIGSLSKTFQWLGHRFVIRTLTVDEMLAVATVSKAYADTIGNGLAYRTALVSLAVASVDGRDLPVPIGDSEDLAWAFQRFDYAKAHWFQFTIDAIYNEYLELEEKTHRVVAAMGKAFAQTGSTTGLSSNFA